MNEQISILIKGKNYEEVSASKFEIQGENFSDEWKSYIKDNYIYIIETFLEKMDKKGIVNTAVGVSKKNKKISLWTPNYHGTSYYGGVAGIIEDTLHIRKGDFFENIKSETSSVDADLTLFIRLEISTRFDENSLFFFGYNVATR